MKQHVRNLVFMAIATIITASCDQTDAASSYQEKIRNINLQREARAAAITGESVNFEVLKLEHRSFVGSGYHSAGFTYSKNINFWQINGELFHFVAGNFWQLDTNIISVKAGKIAAKIVQEKKVYNPYDATYFVPRQIRYNEGPNYQGNDNRKWYRPDIMNELRDYRAANVFEQEDLKAGLIQKIKSDLVEAGTRLNSGKFIIYMGGHLLLDLEEDNQSFKFNTLIFNNSRSNVSPERIQNPQYYKPSLVRGINYFYSPYLEVMPNLNRELETRKFVEKFKTTYTPHRFRNARTFSFRYIGAYRFGGIKQDPKTNAWSVAFDSVCFALGTPPKYGEPSLDQDENNSSHMSYAVGPNSDTKPCDIALKLEKIE